MALNVNVLLYSYSILKIYTFDINKLINISGPFSIYILKYLFVGNFPSKETDNKSTNGLFVNAVNYVLTTCMRGSTLNFFFCSI